MNEDESKEYRKEYLRKYCLKNKERLAVLSKSYNLAHPEVHLRASRKYSEKHRLNQDPESLANTATWIGRRVELDALRLLGDSSIDMNSDKMNNHHFDILWNGLKIDVKGKRLFLKKSKRLGLRPNRAPASLGQWTFHGGSEADAFFCLGYDFDGKTLLKAFLIPKEKYLLHGITCGSGTRKNKYSEFEVPIF